MVVCLFDNFEMNIIERGGGQEDLAGVVIERE